MSGALDKLTSVATGPEPGAADKKFGLGGVDRRARSFLLMAGPVGYGMNNMQGHNAQ